MFSTNTHAKLLVLERKKLIIF